MLMLINTQPQETLQVFAGVPDTHLAITLKHYMDGLPGGILSSNKHTLCGHVQCADFFKPC